MKQILILAKKDILLEFRGKEITFSVLIFAILALIIFNFSLGSEDIKRLAPGILWAIFSFAGILHMDHTFAPEKADDTLEGLRTCPIAPEAIYFSKVLSGFFFMFAIEIITFIIFSILFNLNVLIPQIFLVSLLATIGFVSAGTLFAAIALNTRAQELVLPLLFLPTATPLIIAAVTTTTEALSGKPLSVSWLGIMLAFDILFLAVSYIVFEYAIEE